MTIYITNIRNTIDNEGKAVGHVVKSMQEAIDLIKQNYKYGVIGSGVLLKNFESIEEKYKVPFSQRYKKNINKITCFIKDMANTLIALGRIKNGDALWYIIMSEGAFWGLALMPKKNKKVLVTLYLDYQAHFLNATKFKSIRRWIFEKSCNKIDLAIVSNKNFSLPCRHLFLPDYYISDKVKQIATENKETKVVCLGQMRESRDLDGLVDVFSRTDIKLEVIGQFNDRQWYERLKRKATKNILIEDRKISDDEYYQRLASAAYSIMPYDMSIYHGRTSGVLLDSVFMRCTPIAPDELLKYNSINGIGYHTLDEIVPYIKQGVVKENDLQQYEKENIYKKIIQELEWIL